MSRALVGLPCFADLPCAIRCSFHLGTVSGHILPFSALLVLLESPVPLLLRTKSTESVSDGAETSRSSSTVRGAAASPPAAGQLPVGSSFGETSYVTAGRCQFSDLRFISIRTALYLGYPRKTVSQPSICATGRPGGAHLASPDAHVGAVGLFPDGIRPDNAAERPISARRRPWGRRHRHTG